MKKTFKYMLAAFAVVTAASCAQELEDPNAIPQEDVELVPMTIKVGTESKVTVVDDKTLVWCDDDKIAVWDGVQMREFTVLQADGKTATFQGEVAKGVTQFTAVYPFAAAVGCDSEGVITATVPSVQALDGGNVADNGIVAVCEFSKGEALDFKTANGYLRVDVSYDDVTEIIIDGASVAGTAQFNADGTVKSVGQATGSVSMTPSGEKFGVGSYYIALLPGTTPAGQFNITLVRANNNGAVMTATKEVVIPRNAGFFAQDTKLTESFIIRDAASLKTFLSKAPEYTAGQLATIVNDIDLTGETITSASSFKGTLDGRGHSIKNWTSDSTAFFTIYSGIVKNLVLDSSCKLTPAISGSHFGFITRSIAKYGVMENCVNNADIVFETPKIVKIFFGTLAGITFGTVRGCVNNGDITISVSGNVGDNCAIGGLVGYANVQEQFADKGDGYDIAFEDCKNYGDITYTVDGTVRYLIMGGIAGGTSYNPIASAVFKGRAKNCINEGNISYTFKNGGSLADDAGVGASGNYTSVGGVMGYWEGAIENCVNGALKNGKPDVTKGTVSMVFPTKETGACASRPAVAGVSAFVLQNMTGCTNYGKVYVKGTSSGGDTANAGCGVSGEVCVGGVVAQIGPNGDGSGFTLSNCHNYGELDFNTLMAASNGTGFNHGGVAGYCKVSASNCSNSGKMTVVSKGAYNYTGGVIAQAVYGGTKIENKGTLIFTYKKTTKEQKQVSQNLRVGGVIGVSGGVTSECSTDLESTMTVKTESVDEIKATPYIGGVVGYFTGATFTKSENQAPVTVIFSKQNTQFSVGGVLGHSNSTARTNSELVNRGAVSLKVLETTQGGNCNLGGVAGNRDVGSQKFNACENHGDISYDGVMKMRIGGISGYSNQPVQNCDVTGSITAKCTGKTQSQIGGVIGYYSGSGMSGVTVNADIDATESTTMVYVGGLTGKFNCNNQTYDGCSFDGTLTTSSNNNVPGLYIGGIQTGGHVAKFGATKKCTVGGNSKINGVAVTALSSNNIISQSSDNGTLSATATLTNIVIE